MLVEQREPLDAAMCVSGRLTRAWTWEHPTQPRQALVRKYYCMKVISCTGRTETGIDRVEEAISLDPYHPSWFHYIHGIAAFEAERFETSRVAVNRYIELQHGPFVGLKASALRLRAAANALSLGASRRLVTDQFRAHDVRFTHGRTAGMSCASSSS